MSNSSSIPFFSLSDSHRHSCTLIFSSLLGHIDYVNMTLPRAAFDGVFFWIAIGSEERIRARRGGERGLCLRAYKGVVGKDWLSCFVHDGEEVY